MGAESKQSPPGGADVDELDDDAEPTTSGLALKPKAPAYDDDEDEEREERTELQMDAELVARARHRLLFGRAKPAAGASDPKANAAPGAQPAEAPHPAAAPAAPGIPRRLPTPAPGTLPANASPAATGPTAPPRPAPGAPGPLLSPNVAGPGIARRLPTPPPGSIPSPYGAGPGVPPRGPTPSPGSSLGSAVRPRSGTLIGHGPQGAGPGMAPRAPTPTPAPSSPLHAPSPLHAGGAADVSQSRRAMASDSGLVPAPATPAVGDAPMGDDDFVVQPMTVENVQPLSAAGADVPGSIPTISSDAAITDENPVAPPIDVPAAFAPAPDAAVDPNAPPAAFAPPAATGDSWSQPGSSVSSQGRTGNTGVTGTRKRPKRNAIEYVAMGVAVLAVLWAIWLILFYRR